MSSLLLWSQNNPGSLKVRSFLTEDGLSQSSIQGITQDVFGFMWISTGDGLNCFDGTSFVRYYFHSLGQGTDQSNSLRNVISDNIGNLWVGTDRGLLYLDRSKDVLVQAFPDIPELVNYACLPLFCNSDSISVLVAGMGILSIHKTQHRFSRIPINKGLEGLALLGETQNEKWFGFNSSTIICFKNIPEAGIKLKEYNLNNQTNEFKVAVAKLFEGRYMLATTNNLYLISEVLGKVEKVNLRSWKFIPEDTRIVAMLKDKQNKIWMATSNYGIFILNKDFTLDKHIQNLITNGEILKEFRNILSLYNDRAGNIWIGTDGSGLGVCYSHKPRFALIDRIELGKESIKKPFIRCFLQDDYNRIWIGTYSTGLICWDRDTKQFIQKKLSMATGFPSANDIYCLSPFSKNQILIGTSCGLWIVNILDYTVHPVHGHSEGSSIQKVTGIIPIEGNRLEILLTTKLTESWFWKNFFFRFS
ncbi:MAG: two-component regulator propeller domain-containing protein [Bacteroidales bacterium]